MWTVSMSYMTCAGSETIHISCSIVNGRVSTGTANPRCPTDTFRTYVVWTPYSLVTRVHRREGLGRVGRTWVGLSRGVGDSGRSRCVRSPGGSRGPGKTRNTTRNMFLDVHWERGAWGLWVV